LAGCFNLLKINTLQPAALWPRLAGEKCTLNRRSIRFPDRLWQGDPRDGNPKGIEELGFAYLKSDFWPVLRCPVFAKLRGMEGAQEWDSARVRMRHIEKPEQK
jgi:hypothetical protein